MATTNASTLPVDCLDPVALDELLDFLDDFEGEHRSPVSTANNERVSGHFSPQSPSALSRPSAKPTKPTPRNANRPEKKKKTRPKRHERYWNKKHEMQSLRDEVEYLTNKLDILRQCARSPADARMISELGVTIQNVNQPAHWRRLANHESQVRTRSEILNGKLRALVRHQRQWSINFSLKLDQLASMHDKTDDTTATKPEPWEEILAHLFREACTLAGITAVVAPERLDWSEPAVRLARSKVLLEWATAFPVSRSDSVDMGETWWRSFIERKPTDCTVVSPTPQQSTTITPRMHRTCLLSLKDDAGNPIKASMATFFELHKHKDTSIIAACCVIYDSEGDEVLFSATSTIIFASSLANSECAVVRAHTRVLDPEERQTPSSHVDFDGDKLKLVSNAKVAINFWANAIRKRDENLKLTFSAA